MKVKITSEHTGCKVDAAFEFSSVQSLRRVQLCDLQDYSMPGFPVHHQLPELAQTNVH